LGTVANYYQFEKKIQNSTLSVDGLESHLKWIKDIEETQNVTLQYPIIADESKTVANLYDMIHPNANETFTVRSVFIIGPDKKIKLTLTYPASTEEFR
jgi:alkyl hydroperoxide reductase subunit AhpC